MRRFMTGVITGNSPFFTISLCNPYFSNEQRAGVHEEISVYAKKSIGSASAALACPGLR